VAGVSRLRQLGARPHPLAAPARYHLAGRKRRDPEPVRVGRRLRASCAPVTTRPERFRAGSSGCLSRWLRGIRLFMPGWTRFPKLTVAGSNPSPAHRKARTTGRASGVRACRHVRAGQKPGHTLHGVLAQRAGMLVCREETCRLVGETPSAPTNRLNEHRCKMLGHWTCADRPRTSIRSGAALANARSGQPGTANCEKYGSF
jgi:hypothetical protein